MTYNAPIGSAFETATVSNSALSLLLIGFTQAQIDAADKCFVTVASNSIRYTFVSGVTPDASTGHLVAANASFEILGNTDIQNLLLIRATGSDGAVSVTLSKFA